MSRKLVIVLGVALIVLLAAPLTLPKSLQTPEKIQKTNFRELFGFLIDILKKIWQKFPALLQKLLTWLKYVFSSYIHPFFNSIWDKLKNVFSKELTKNKALISKEFKEKKAELKEALRDKFFKIANNVWEKAEGLLR